MPANGSSDDHPSRAELSADAHEEGIEAAARAVPKYTFVSNGQTWDEANASQQARRLAMVRPIIDAYLEALNAH